MPAQPPSKMTVAQTAEEEASLPAELKLYTHHLTTIQKNIEVAKEYMRIAYSPTENKGRDSVKHLCTDDSWFFAPTTFPGCETPLDYADSHSKVMSAIADLHIVQFDQAWAKDGHVLLRYTAQGTHCGKPHNGIEATGRHAKWGAAAIFEVKDGKVHSFTKDWDKLHMWQQLGWMKPENDAVDYA